LIFDNNTTVEYILFSFFLIDPLKLRPLFFGILTLIKIYISLTNQNAASLSNMHPCNNVRVSGGIARGENDIDSHRSSKYTISNDFIF
jgi:hypothetical protein